MTTPTSEGDSMAKQKGQADKPAPIDAAAAATEAADAAAAALDNPPVEPDPDPSVIVPEKPADEVPPTADAEGAASDPAPEAAPAVAAPSTEAPATAPAAPAQEDTDESAARSTDGEVPRDRTNNPAQYSPTDGGPPAQYS